MKETTGFLWAAVGVLVFATTVLVAAPWLYIRRQETGPPLTLDPAIERGRRQYVAMGCVYCHSQQPRPESVSRADAAWGWGSPGTSQSYAGQTPHLLGTMRTGPDLLRIGDRQPSRDWQLLHLYQPRLLVPESIMPSYPFLFDLTEEQPASGGVKVPTGGWLAPHPEAEDLLAYLLHLKEDPTP